MPCGSYYPARLDAQAEVNKVEYISEIVEIFIRLSPADRLEALAYLIALAQADNQDTTAASSDSQE